MTDPERPPGTHRRARSSNRLAVLIASLVAIAVVAVIVTITLDKRGEPAHNNAPAASGSTLAKHSPSASVPSSATSPSGSAIASPPSTPPTTQPPTIQPPTASTPSTTAAQHRLPALDLLNDSRITGLAARASEQFRAAGWPIASTGNFKGADVPETTIFYPDGEKAAADRLAAQFGIHRLVPATSGLSSSHLTVALARDWADHN